MLRSLFINERFPKGSRTMKTRAALYARVSREALTVAALPLPDSPVCLGRWYTPAVPKKPKPVRLTAAQIEIVGRFNDLSLEKPRMTFEQVARKMLGLIPFSKTTSGRRFEKECRKVFDKE
jgi:hypothetical protein